jgi:hypothetical protein
MSEAQPEAADRRISSSTAPRDGHAALSDCNVFLP